MARARRAIVAGNKPEGLVCALLRRGTRPACRRTSGPSSGKRWPNEMAAYAKSHNCVLGPAPSQSTTKRSPMPMMRFRPLARSLWHTRSGRSVGISTCQSSGTSETGLVDGSHKDSDTPRGTRHPAAHGPRQDHRAPRRAAPRRLVAWGDGRRCRDPGARAGRRRYGCCEGSHGLRSGIPDPNDACRSIFLRSAPPPPLSGPFIRHGSEVASGPTAGVP